MRMLGIGVVATLLVVSGCGSQVSKSTDPSAAANDPVIYASGDIACDQGGVSEAEAPRGTAAFPCEAQQTADVITGATSAAAVLALGDNQYQSGQLAEYLYTCPTQPPASGCYNGFDYSWGKFLGGARHPATTNILMPVTGNHDYTKNDGCNYCGSDYFAYFNGGTEQAPNPTGPAGTSLQGWYSKDIGSWHLIALNSECSKAGIGCAAGTAQYKFLQADLAATNQPCIAAFWHEPLFSQGQEGGNPAVLPLWQLLEAKGADVILNGHNHDYERYQKETDGQSPSATGIAQFVVGTGGAGLQKQSSSVVTPPQASIFVTSTSGGTHGVLQMTLHANSYDYKYLPTSDSTFSDASSSSIPCNAKTQ